MELRMRDGDYVPDGRGDFEGLEGGEAVLQRALFLLTVRRGSFPLLPNLGSRLYLLPRERGGARAALARQYAAEALSALTGVSVTGATLAEQEDGQLGVRVQLEWGGEHLEAALVVAP